MISDWKTYCEGRKAEAQKYELYETHAWAVHKILEAELMPKLIIDPCCGRGVMSEIAKGRGYLVSSSDIFDWGYGDIGVDFLSDYFDLSGKGVFINPPFSLACQFVERALDLGARKIVCFQRFAWWESDTRRAWWEKYPPNRIYICGARASCWRGDIPLEDRKSGSPTAHAWFVWERGQPKGTLTGHIWKPKMKK